ncbi:hypothetical protein [Anaerosalibacter sp. Marseille-P3206]|uniref:hypothetical protein n=1 Tax=Anaerosalibacter sp. Marseille-P3206 TaxID=1871005 RepID=UPI000985AFA9|nr:hypothetical protein [Anaerosalibacter sp. Marseille-P3206]
MAVGRVNVGGVVIETIDKLGIFDETETAMAYNNILSDGGMFLFASAGNQIFKFDLQFNIIASANVTIGKSKINYDNGFLYFRTGTRGITKLDISTMQYQEFTDSDFSSTDIYAFDDDYMYLLGSTFVVKVNKFNMSVVSRASVKNSLNTNEYANTLVIDDEFIYVISSINYNSNVGTFVTKAGKQALDIIESKKISDDYYHYPHAILDDGIIYAASSISSGQSLIKLRSSDLVIVASASHMSFSTFLVDKNNLYLNGGSTLVRKVDRNTLVEICKTINSYPTTTQSHPKHPTELVGETIFAIGNVGGTAPFKIYKIANTISRRRK